MKRIHLFIIICLSLTNPIFFPPAASPQVFDFQWGTAGSGQGQFNQPVGIAIDTLGNVYVCDAGNNRIQKFDANGTYLTSWGTGGVCQGIGIDAGNNVYVADWFNNNLKKYDSNGVFVTSWGTIGSSNGQFQNPHGVAVDSSNNVYVTDWGNHRVQKFSSTGSFLTAWGSSGTANGQFNNPRAITIDASGRIYVGDATNRIQIFDSTGTYLGTWGASGRGDGQLIDSMGIDFDSSGNFYVSEFGNSRVQKWNESGNYLTKWGVFGSDAGTFDWPYGVAINSTGEIYVVDSRNNRIQAFKAPLPSTLDASGVWNYSITNSRIVDSVGWDCFYDGNGTGTLTITQNGEYVSATAEGTTYSGFVSGATYNLSAADQTATDEIVSEMFILALSSPTSASGNIFSSDTDNVGSFCIGEADLAITKQTSSGGGGGGGGGGGCFISSLLP